MFPAWCSGKYLAIQSDLYNLGSQIQTRRTIAWEVVTKTMYHVLMGCESLNGYDSRKWKGTLERHFPRTSLADVKTYRPYVFTCRV